MSKKVETVTEKVNSVLEKFSHSELKTETALPGNDYKDELPWALDQINSCIGKVEKVINKDGETAQLGDTFKRAPAFDGDTMNFHVFPLFYKEYEDLCKCIGIKRVETINKLNEKLTDCEEFRKIREELSPKVKSNIHVGEWNGKKIKLFSTGTTLSDLEKTYKGFVDLTSNNAFYVLAGAGSKDDFRQYKNWYKKLKDENKENVFGARSNIYKFISFYYNQKWYNLNFMRFYQEDGKVNCDFKSLQYDCVVSGGSVNATADANVCDVCYPYSSANGECHVNSVGNICYNPYISFYDDEELILKDFINFIECCDKLINHNNNSINEKYNDGFISSQQFADILRKSITPTPLTKAFEKTSLAQNKNRWWDNSTGEQKEHLVCWFSRKFNGGSTEECMKNNLGSNCENCYFSKIKKKPSGFGEQIDAQLVFERMGRPEMYFHIAESLGVLERNQLEKFIEEVKVNIDNWRNIRKKYLSWDMVRNKVLEELKNE